MTNGDINIASQHEGWLEFPVKLIRKSLKPKKLKA